MTGRYFRTLATVVLLPVMLMACDDLFEYSPYQVKTDDTGTDRNIEAIQRIGQKSAPAFKPFKIAVIGDSHTYYDEFGDQVKALNRLDSIDFVVHLGDFTLSGIYREFVWYGNIIDGVERPVITVIGNHDCLSNGETMYRQMFGPYSFAIDYNGCKLLFFDDNIWERNVEDPDFAWLDTTLATASSSKYRFVFSHIPPWDEQFSTGNGYLFNHIMEQRNVTASLHGHTHKHRHAKYYGKIPYMVTGDSQDREIMVLEVLPDTVTVKLETY